MRKLLKGALFTGVVLALLAAVPAFADTYPYLTFEDSNDFTIVKPQLSSENITAMGLDASFQKQTISDPQNITWSSSNSVVAFVYPTSGANVTVYTFAQGEATVTASYTNDDNTVITCPANIVVERLTNPVNEVTGVPVKIVGSQGSGIDIDFTGQNAIDVPLFELTEIWPAMDDSDVLPMDPTAMHALLYALELAMDDDTYEYGDANWDWDWVDDNVVLDSQGSYLMEIAGDVSGWPVGWKYEIGGQSYEAAASIIKVSTDTLVDWAYE